MEKLRIMMPKNPADGANGLPGIQLNGRDITEKVASIIIRMKPGDCSVLIHLQQEPDNSNSPSAILGAPFTGVIDISTDEFPIRQAI